MNERPVSQARRFAPRLTRAETVIGWVYLPIHVFLLPILLGMFQELYPSGNISDILVNLIYYGISLAVVAVCFLRLLRREFDHLCDRLASCMYTFFLGWMAWWVVSYLIALVTMLLGVEAENPNDMTIGAMLSGNYYRMMAISAIGAPLVEETLFRGVVFQSLRRKGRVLAYVVSGGLFCLYHVWSYALAEGNALLLLYALQYVPVTLIMTWVYERSGSLWTSVFFHSSYNFLSLFAMRQLQLIS